MLWWIYEIVFWTALLIASPYQLLRMRRRGGYARDFGERFGSFSPAKKARLQNLKPIWIHGVSVGEVDLAIHLISALRKKTAIPILLSTTTSTGHALALRKLPAEVPVIYYPLDSRFCFTRVHKLIRPRAFILIEAELWPNHLRFCAERNIPLLLLNARLSRRFLPRYRQAKWLFSTSFHAFKGVTTQAGEDGSSLVELGFQEQNILPLGSLKFDTASAAATPDGPLIQELSRYGQRRCLVAGSTHSGEEAILRDIFLNLKARYPDLWLLLAPRHAERAGEIEDLLRTRSLEFIRRSQLPSSTKTPDVVLLDTTGELKTAYTRADIVFMGKSLVGRGGQNILEPAACSKAILFGPEMQNFEHIAADFLKARAAIQIASATDLESQIDSLLSHPAEAHALGQRARQLIDSRKGVLNRTLEFVLQKIA